MASIPVVNTHDKNMGIIAAVAVLVLLFIYILLIHFQLPDPPITNPPLKAEAVFDEIELKELTIQSAGGASAGQASNDEVKEPTPQMKEVATAPNPDVKVTSGKSSNTNTTKPTQNESSTTAQDNNPFSNGGDGNNNQGGQGNIVGKDDGKEGTGGGTIGFGKDRIRNNEISTDNIYTSSVVSVKLILTINEEGRVVAARVVNSGTTTTDTRIIGQVIAACKAQLTYQKLPGAGLQDVYYTAQLRPN